LGFYLSELISQGYSVIFLRCWTKHPGLFVELAELTDKKIQISGATLGFEVLKAGKNQSNGLV
jgi:hypothetical protein